MHYELYIYMQEERERNENVIKKYTDPLIHIKKMENFADSCSPHC